MPDGLTPQPSGLTATICDTPLWLDLSGTVLEPATQTLIVADLHFEKASSIARTGQLLPPYDTRSTLRKLESVIAQFQPRRLIALGDSFHDLGAHGRMHADDFAHLLSLVHALDEWVWIAGNHDPEPPEGLGGVCVPKIVLRGLTLCHEPSENAVEGELAGHLHPCAKVRVRHRTFRRRCFAGDATRLILPAFGALTGGLNVCDEAFTRVFGRTPEVYLMGDKKLFSISPDKLRAD